MKNKNRIIQKLVFFGFLIASCIVILASLSFVSKDWTVLFSTKNNESSSFYYELKRTIVLAKTKKYKFDSLPRGLYTLIFDSEENAKAYYQNVWFGIQNINNCLFALGIGSLVTVAACAITGSFSRRKFYVSNLVTSVVAGLYGIIMSSIILVKTHNVKSDFNYLRADFDLYLDACEKAKKAPISNTINDANFSISTITCIIFMIICVGFIAYTVYRFVISRKQTHKTVNMEAISNE